MSLGEPYKLEEEIMAHPKLTPNDARVEHHNVTVNGKNYHYLLANPPDGKAPRATILLVHGFPDLSFGWRYQVPFLANELQLRVIVPDQIGYGRTDAPQGEEHYSLKSIASDLAALLQHVLGVNHQPVILGGHDWGGMAVWRMAMWQPQAIGAVFSICTPFGAPLPYFISNEDYFKFLPNFRYQLHFMGPEVQEKVQGRDMIRQFLRGLYGGRTPEGEAAFSTDQGVLFDKLGRVGPSPLVSDEEIEYYVDEYMRHGDIRGPLNWYRQRKRNWEEDQELIKAGRTKVSQPSMLVMATNDSALPPAMAQDQEKHFDSLVRKQVDASHWALWQTPNEVNGHIKEFVEGFLKVKASI